MADYEIFLSTPGNTRIALLPKFISLSMALVVNGVSQLSLILPGVEYDIDDFDHHYRLEIERDGLLLGGAPFFIKRKTLSLDASGQYLITLDAAHANTLLNDREILYYAGHASSTASAESADDLCRRLVTENLGADAADADRDIAGPVDVINVESNAGQGPNVTLNFARDRLIDALNDITEKSRNAGTPLFFGIEQDSDRNLEFRVRTDQWGNNRTGQSIVAPEFGNLTNVSRSWDWSEKITVAVALGRGLQDNRLVATATNVTTADSYFWIERATNDSSQTGAAALADAAAARLEAGRTVETLSGEIQEVAGFAFNSEWGWGDKIDTNFNDEEISTWINTVQINLADGRETINTRLEVVL